MSSYLNDGAEGAWEGGQAPPEIPRISLPGQGLPPELSPPPPAFRAQPCLSAEGMGSRKGH